MRSCPRQLAARLPPPRLPTSALAGPALPLLKVMMDAGQSNTRRGGAGERFVDVRLGSLADMAPFRNQCPLNPQKRTLKLSRVMSALCQKRTLRDAAKRYLDVGREFNRQIAR